MTANTPSTDTTKLRVDACLAEYKVLSDEIRCRNKMQVTATIVSAIVLYGTYALFPRTAIGVVDGGRFGESIFRPHGIVAGSVILSLLGAYLLSQATAITRIQRYIDSNIRPSVESALGHSLMEWHGMMNSERKGQPFLKMVARYMPIHIFIAFGSVVSLLVYPVSTLTMPSIAFGSESLEESIRPDYQTWIFFLIGALCLGWYILAFLKLRKEYEVPHSPPHRKPQIHCLNELSVTWNADTLTSSLT